MAKCNLPSRAVLQPDVHFLSLALSHHLPFPSFGSFFPLSPCSQSRCPSLPGPRLCSHVTACYSFATAGQHNPGMQGCVLQLTCINCMEYFCLYSLRCKLYCTVHRDVVMGKQKSIWFASLHWRLIRWSHCWSYQFCVFFLLYTTLTTCRFETLLANVPVVDLNSCHSHRNPLVTRFYSRKEKSMETFQTTSVT